LLLDPLGQSALVDLTGKVKPQGYAFDDVRWLLVALQGDAAALAQLRIESNLSHRELRTKLDWATQQLQAYGLSPKPHGTIAVPNDSPRPTIVSKTLESFAD
jgi:hypothetical protein